MAFYNQHQRGGSIAIYDEGVLITSNATSINFTGAGVTGSNIGGDVTETIPGGSGTFAVMTPSSGSVNGTNLVFTFANAPSVVVVDNGNQMNKVSADGTQNWTGTTTITLLVAPTFNIYAY